MVVFELSEMKQYIFYFQTKFEISKKKNKQNIPRMVWFVMLNTSWVTVVSDFICSIVLASIKIKNTEFL